MLVPAQTHRHPRLTHSALGIACLTLLCSAGLTITPNAHAMGESYLINMPTGRLEADGTWRVSFDYQKPYRRVYTEATILPWLQGGWGVTSIQGVQGFTNNNTFRSYGSYKDKNFFLRMKLRDESERWPALSLSVQDPVGTSIFRSAALSASKRFGTVDATLGYGTDRWKGWYAGAKWQPQSTPDWSFLIETDPTDYVGTRYAKKSGIADTKQKIAAGVRWMPKDTNWTVQLSHSAHQPKLGVSYAIPLQTDTNVRFSKPSASIQNAYVVRRPTAQAWQSNPEHRQLMLRELHTQGYRQVDVALKGDVLHLQLTHPNMAFMSQTVGRAVQTVLFLSPTNTREIHVHYHNPDTGQPFVRYLFADTTALYNYFTGQRNRANLESTMRVHMVDTRLAETWQRTQAQQLSDKQAILNAGKAQADIQRSSQGASQAQSSLGQDSSGRVSLSWQSGDGKHQVAVYPTISAYLNGPKAFQYAIDLKANYNVRFTPSFQGSLTLAQTVTENISDRRLTNDSPLPHVRSDYPLYRSNHKLRVEKAVLNYYGKWGKELYSLVGAGYFEPMYSGATAQLLYAPENKPWAFTGTLNALRQRDPKRTWEHTDYSVTTGRVAMHYRLAGGITFTARAGRFLAKDKGVRLEIKRRFNSGVELGAWYTHTDAKDYGGPARSEGSSPYRDKGVFASIPFDALLPMHSRQKAVIALSPWSRDVGQMASTGDIYALYEDDLINLQLGKGMQYFAGPYDDYVQPSVPPGIDINTPPTQVLWDSVFDFAENAQGERVVKDLALGTVATVVAASSDKRFDKYAIRYGKRPTVKRLSRAGDTLAYAGLVASGLIALDDSSPVRGRVGKSSFQAGATALLLTRAGQSLIERSSPRAGRGNAHFGGSSKHNGFLSPSTATMMAVVTPYAKAYDAPWLYGLGVFTGAATVSDRKNWFSDAVAGGIIGYSLGSYYYERGVQELTKPEEQPNLYITPNGVQYETSF